MVPNVVTAYADSNDISGKIGWNVQLQQGDSTKTFLGTFGSVAIRGYNPMDSHDSNTLYSSHSSLGMAGVTGSSGSTGEGQGVVGYAQGNQNILYGTVGIVQRLSRTDATNIAKASTVLINGNVAGTYISDYAEITTNKAGYAATDAQNPRFPQGRTVRVTDNRNTGANLELWSVNDGTQVVLINSNGIVFLSKSIVLQTNAWAGPTNSLDLLNQDQYYTTLTALSVTGFSGAISGNSHSVQLSIYNGSGSNVDLTLPTGAIQGEGVTGAITITNNTRRIVWFKVVPGISSGTNVVTRSF